jgi:hypothetical protein
VDSDDKLLPNALEDFLGKIDDSTDIVMNTCYFIGTDEIFTYGSYKDLEVIDIKHFIKRNINLDGGEPWGKLYRRRLFNKETFNIPREVFCGEDVIMNIKLAFASNKDIKTIDKPQYFHRIHCESVFYNFKHEPEYEEIFRENLVKSIPHECFAYFSNEYIGSRFRLWRECGGCNLRKPLWAGTQFHKQLIRDIKTYNFKMLFFEKMLLYHTHQPLRAMIFIGRKVCYVLKRIINKFIP